MSRTDPRHDTPDAFWLHYLREHADPRTRRWHLFGTAAGMILLLSAILSGRWWLLLLAVVAGYAFAWGSHALIERNRPATFSAPLRSLGSDVRMAWLMVTNRLEPELRRAGVTRR